MKKIINSLFVFLSLLVMQTSCTKDKTPGTTTAVPLIKTITNLDNTPNSVATYTYDADKRLIEASYGLGGVNKTTYTYTTNTVVESTYQAGVLKQAIPYVLNSDGLQTSSSYTYNADTYTSTTSYNTDKTVATNINKKNGVVTTTATYYYTNGNANADSIVTVTPQTKLVSIYQYNLAVKNTNSNANYGVGFWGKNEVNAASQTSGYSKNLATGAITPYTPQTYTYVTDAAGKITHRGGSISPLGDDITYY
jgi:hypothetical protein